MSNIEMAQEYIATHGTDWFGLSIVLTITLVSFMILVFSVLKQNR